MNLLKKQGAGAYLLLIAFLLSIASLIIYAVNSSAGYYVDTGCLTIPLSIIALVVAVVAFICGEFADRNIVIAKLADILRIAFPVLIMCALKAFLSYRVESYGIVFGSDLESDNALAQSSVMLSLIGLAFYAVTAIIGVVSAYFEIKRTDR